MHCSVGHLASAGGAAPRTTLWERERPWDMKDETIRDVWLLIVCSGVLIKALFAEHLNNIFPALEKSRATERESVSVGLSFYHLIFYHSVYCIIVHCCSNVHAMVLSFSFHLSVCLLFYRSIYCSTVLLFNLSFCLPSYHSIFCLIVQSIAHLFNPLVLSIVLSSSLSFNVYLLIYHFIVQSVVLSSIRSCSFFCHKSFFLPLNVSSC